MSIEEWGNLRVRRVLIALPARIHHHDDPDGFRRAEKTQKISPSCPGQRFSFVVALNKRQIQHQKL
jgi:hypothetical protein